MHSILGWLHNMAELGSDENKIKRFLANFNTLQARPKKKERKHAENEAVRLSYKLTGHVRKFIPE